MRHWKVEIKEVGNDHPVKSEYIGDEHFDEIHCVEFWGLKNPDVEWYKLEEVKDPESADEISDDEFAENVESSAKEYMEFYDKGYAACKEAMLKKAMDGKISRYMSVGPVIWEITIDPQHIVDLDHSLLHDGSEVKFIILNDD